MFGKGSSSKSCSIIKVSLILVLALSFSASGWAGEPGDEQATSPPLTRVYQPLMLRAMQYVESTGVLDPSFGGDGRVNTNFGFSNEYSYASALQADGKLVVAGYFQGNDQDFALVRYNPDGSPDTNFDDDGWVVSDVAGRDDSARAVAVQADGKIVVAGYAHNGENNDIAVVRYNPDGSLDTSFDEDGKVLTDFSGSDDSGYSIAILEDGKIIVVGYANNSTNADFAVVRYRPDGSLDPDFGSLGKVVTDFAGNTDWGFAATIQEDSKIVVAGMSGGTTADIALARYNPNGSPDTTFGDNGRVVTDVAGGNDWGFSIAQQTDDKLVVAGIAVVEDVQDFVVVRYKPDGSLDPDFGSLGKVVTDVIGGADSGRAMTLQPDDKIVVAGYVFSTTVDIAVVRYNSNGELDTDFGSLGKVVTDVSGGTDRGWSVTLDLDENIVVAGNSTSTSSDFAVVRYTSDGNLDTDFSEDGIVLTNLAGSRDEGSAVARQPDGKIVVAGHSAGDFALARYSSYGGLDLNFDGDGKVVTTVSNGNDEINAVVLQTDGKIVAAGYAWNGTNDDFALARYKPDGSLDTTFDGDGLVITDLAGGHDRGYGVALQSDGKIVVVGVAYNGTNDDFAVVRYRPDGSLDPDFGSLGKVLTDFAGGGDEAQDVVLQTDGKIVVVGSASGDIALARYNPNGSLDGSFSTDGKVMSDFSSSDGAKAVVLQPDGKIVVAGTVWGGADDFAIARYYPNGILDSNFSGDGLAVLSLKGGPEVLYDVVLQANGKIIAAGGSITNYVPDLIIDYDFTILRYHPDGSLDTSFDGDGIVYTSFGVGIDGASGVLLLPDGKILAVGSMDNGMDNDLALARYK